MNFKEHLLQKLQNGLQVLEISLEREKQETLIDYLLQLHKWNQAFNLSGIKDIQEMLTLHLLDSVALLPYVDGKGYLADVGTGAGLPAVPLAISLPDQQVYALDSNNKKIRFIFQTCQMLKIKNIEAKHTRVEHYAAPHQVDIVLSRAFASIKDFVVAAKHILSPNGCFLAMKGLYPEAEIKDLPTGFEVTAVHKLHIPTVAAERHLVEIRIIP